MNHDNELEADARINIGRRASETSSFYANMMKNGNELVNAERAKTAEERQCKLEPRLLRWVKIKCRFQNESFL